MQNKWYQKEKHKIHYGYLLGVDKTTTEATKEDECYEYQSHSLQ